MKKRLTKDKIMNASTYTLVTVAFVILQLLMSQGKLSSTMKGFLVPACAYIVLAISLNLLVGICGELSLGHAGFMGIGAFTGVIVTALLATAVPNGIVRLVIAMVVGGVMAGALYAMNYGSITASKFNFNTSINILVFVVLGGMGNILGSIISATVLYILPEAMRGLQDYRMILYAVVLIVVMLFTWSPKVKEAMSVVTDKLAGIFKKKEAGTNE